VTRIVHLSRDVTYRRLVEEALKRDSEKVKLFAYSVAHDLKSPAVGIHGLTQRLYKHYAKALDEKGKNYCSQILKASEQIVALVENINLFISAKETPLSIEQVKLEEILRALRDEFSAQLNSRCIRLLEPDNSPEIKADRLSVTRMLRNLIDNALKYGGDNLSEIRIAHEESEEFHIISVADDGIGVGKEESEKIFDPFQRNHLSRRIEGTGLGLAIVKEIAKQHGGKVWSEAGKGKGTIFYMAISKDLKLSEI
jgi:signal transduction histidine kinase